MLCNCCEHRRRNIEAKQKKEAYVPQPRCECGDAGSVCGCYMFQPMQLPVMAAAQGDRRPIGGPSLIAARVRASELAAGTGIFMVAYGPKKNREFVYVRRPLTKEEQKAQKEAEKETVRWRKKMVRQIDKERKAE